MPNYNPALTRALYPGEQETLADSTLASPFTTVAIAVVDTIDGNTASLTFFNSTNQSATIEAASADADGNYTNTLNTVAAGTMAIVPTGNVPFVRALLAGAVTSGTLVVTR